MRPPYHYPPDRRPLLRHKQGTMRLQSCSRRMLSRLDRLWAMTDATVTLNRYSIARLTFETIALLSGGLIVVPLLVTAAAYIQRASLLPQLVQPDSILGRHFLLASESHLRSTGDGLLVQPDRGRWPGIVLEEVWPDWRGYSSLLIDLANPNIQELTVVVRIDDRRPDPKYKDRYNREFEVAPRSRRVIRIPLPEIESAPQGSLLDLAHLEKIILFQDGKAPTYPFYLNSMRLEH